ncbi:endonuclease V [Paenibacillus faecis]|uniref:deoxyribonuclease V n=1 Tax=Paenibacillus faecis TaxID=862114 RepID=UPI001B06A668|nr:deoxyribonuclease V [Paenibacillus faecis]GIO86730.1 endonuclease V [Paenibacillus faecis]
MKPITIHPWELNEEEAVSLQRELAKKVIQQDQPHDITYVAGVDVAYSKESDVLIAAVVILEAASLKLVESVTVEDRVHFPYIPGLFSFRELPPVIKAFEQIKIQPDLVVCDGQGIAHPRRFGLASHLGVLLDIPTIGCGKTRLLGTYDEPGDSRGSHSSLIDNDEVVGHVLRTQDHVKPIFVSIGHKISLDAASAWILKLSPQYRLPETTRQADHLVKIALSRLNPS